MARLTTRSRRTCRDAPPPVLAPAPARPATLPAPAAWLQWQRVLGNARAAGLMRQPGSGTAFPAAVTAPIRVDGTLQRRAETTPAAALLQGSRGPAVVHLQARLNAHGAAPPLAEDGVFGPRTQAATLAYQRSHGLVPDAVAGPRTRASLDSPPRPGGSAPAGGAGGAGGPGSHVVEYDTGAQRFAPPAPGTTMSQVRDAIKVKQDRRPLPDLGATVAAIGVAAGSAEEVFVWNVLLQRAERRFWGGEIDVVTAIGPVPKGATVAPKGQVTVRLDGQGNGNVELVARGAVTAPSAFADDASARAALVKDFAVAAVRDGGAAWTLADLNKAHAALSRLQTADRAALHGVVLVRDATLADARGNPLSGLFEHSASLAAGATTATRAEALHLADSAFATDDIGFIGGRGNAAAESFEVILHEAGHAVEGHDLREAQFARLQAQGTLNAAITQVNDAVGNFNPEMRGAFARARSYTRPQRTSARTFLAGVNAATAAIDAYARGDDATRHARREATAGAAIAARDARRARLPARHPADADFAQACSLQDDWFRAAQARATAHSAVATATKAEAAASDPDRAGRSRHLKDFVDVVTASRIPPLTEYAKANWPGHPEEFFAEAYSLWLNDPEYLNTNARALKDWFDAGAHRK